MIFKSTYEIINDPWKEKTDEVVSKLPPAWTKEIPISIEDVTIWEQIYHQPGNIGIYVAWSPYTEFYLIAYDLFTKTSAGIKTFIGPDAVAQVQKIASDLNITLPESRIQL
jgi:hypothetical protein